MLVGEMKILQIPVRFYPSVGGVENQVYYLSKDLVKLKQAESDDTAVFKDGQWWVNTIGDYITNMEFDHGGVGVIPVVGDFNQDGTADIALFKDCQWWVDTNGDHCMDIHFAYGVAGYTPVVGEIG